MHYNTVGIVKRKLFKKKPFENNSKGFFYEYPNTDVLTTVLQDTVY